MFAKKFIFPVVLLSVAALTGCGGGGSFKAPWARSDEAPAAAASAPTKTVIICKNGEASTKEEVEESQLQKALEACDKSKHAKVAAKAAKPAHNSNDSLLAELRATRHRNEQLAVQLAASQQVAPAAPVMVAVAAAAQQSAVIPGAIQVTALPMPNHAQPGKVYTDGSGNTYQRDEGDRVCNFAVNGRHVQSLAIENTPDKALSAAACNMEWLKFKDSMRPTTALGAK